MAFFPSIFGNNNTPDSQTGLDINKALLEQLSKRDYTPEFKGKGAWWGSAATGVNDLATQYRAQKLQEMQARLSQGQAGAAGATLGVKPQAPQAPPVAGSGGVGPGPGSMPSNAPRLPSGMNTPSPGPGAAPITTGSLPPSGSNAPQGVNTSPTQGKSVVTPQYIQRLIQIESGGNPTARTGSYRGLGQFSRTEEHKYGINDDNWTDPRVQHAAIEAKSLAEENMFVQRMGRYPSPGELYLVHQQGLEGATNHIRNPNAPAWMNMYATGEGQEKGQGWAHQAIRGNLPTVIRPGSNDITSGEFSTYWKNKFEHQPQQPMHLGAEGVQPPNQPEQSSGPQLAQAESPNQLSEPGAIRPQSYGAARLPTPTEMQELIRQFSLAGMKPDQIQEVLKGYITQAGGRTEKGPGGEFQVMPQPGDQKPIVTAPRPETAEGYQTSVSPTGITAPQIPTFGERGEPTGSRLVAPGVATSGDTGGEGGPAKAGMSGFSPIMEALREESAKTSITGGQAEGVKKNMTDAIEAGGTHAQEALTTLKTMKELNKNAAMSGGPMHAFSMEIRQFIDNLAPGYLSPDLPDSEVFKKMQTFVASEYAKTLSSRVSNFNFRTFLENTPNLVQSQRGRGILIDLMEQELERRVGLSKKASAMGNAGWRGWNDVVDDYYKEHYPILRDPKSGTIHLRQFGSKEEMEKHVGKGERFLLNDGSTSKPRP